MHDLGSSAALRSIEDGLCGLWSKGRGRRLGLCVYGCFFLVKLSILLCDTAVQDDSLYVMLLRVG